MLKIIGLIMMIFMGVINHYIYSSGYPENPEKGYIRLNRASFATDEPFGDQANFIAYCIASEVMALALPQGFILKTFMKGAWAYVDQFPHSTAPFLPQIVLHLPSLQHLHLPALNNPFPPTNCIAPTQMLEPWTRVDSRG